MIDLDVLRLAEVRRMLSDGRARGIREASGVSQSEVAAALGVSRAALSSWEVGRRAPRGEVAVRYGALLRAFERQVERPEERCER